MIGAMLPVALLFTTLALFLGFVPKRAVLPAIGVLVATSAAAAMTGGQLPYPGASLPMLWACLIVIAVCVHIAAARQASLAIAFAGAAGIAGGLLIAVQGSLRDLMLALPCVLLCVPARLIVARGWSIALRVLASWLVAVAMLVAFLPLVHTPGYVPDHME